MGASICRQQPRINTSMMMEDQIDIKPKIVDLNLEISQKQNQPKVNEEQIDIQDAGNINQQNEGQNKSESFKDDNKQVLELLGRGISESLLIKSQLVSSQNQDVLIGLNQSCQAYPKFGNEAKIKLLESSKIELTQSFQCCPKFAKESKMQQIANLQIVEDNLDDYLYYDWQKAQFQLLSINDQTLLKKVNQKKPKKKQTKKQY